MGNYLDLEAILPGDIIMSSARTFLSYSIRASTFSMKVSHAALAIHPLIWFEAVGRGVGYNIIQPEFIWDGERVRLAMKIPKGERYFIKRPKSGPYDGVNGSQKHDIAKKFIHETGKFAFLNYAGPEAFLRTLRFGLSDTALVRFITNNMNKNRDVLYSGPFCSWLVAECYANMHCDLFDKAPNTITPAAIYRSKKLKSIPTIISGDPIIIKKQFLDFTNWLSCYAGIIRNTLSALSLSATISKFSRSRNVDARGVSYIDRSLSGLSVPSVQDELHDAIDASEREKFESYRLLAIKAIEDIYPDIAAHAEQIDKLNRCYNNCLAPSPRGQICEGIGSDSCTLITIGFLESYANVRATFPA